MGKTIEEQVSDAMKNAYQDVKRDIASIIHRAKYTGDVVKLYKDEILKVADYNDTVAGMAYINSNFQDKSEPQWKYTLIKFYSRQKYMKDDSFYLDAFHFLYKLFMEKWLNVCIDTYNNGKLKTHLDEPPEHIKPIKPDEYSWIMGDEEQQQKTLRILRSNIGNKTAKEACRFIKAAMRAGAITKPTFTQIHKEFLSLTKTPYNNQMKRNDDDSEIVPLIHYFEKK